MPPLNSRYVSQSSPKAKTYRGREKAKKQEIPDSSSKQLKKKKSVPFVMSYQPTGENYLNYIMVKEQQKMKNSRLKLLNTLEKQRHRFKYYLK